MRTLPEAPSALTIRLAVCSRASAYLWVDLADFDGLRRGVNSGRPPCMRLSIGRRMGASDGGIATVRLGASAGAFPGIGGPAIVDQPATPAGIGIGGGLYRAAALG